MKIKIAIIAGLFLACTSVPRAQDNPQNSEHLYDAVIPAIPVMYEGADSTNSGIFLIPNAGPIEDDSMINEYPLLILSQEEAMVFTEGEREEPGDTQTAEGETTYLDNITERELRHWLEESFSSTNETAAEVGNSNLVQVIFIEPLTAPGIDISDDILLPEAGYRIVHAPPEWYEWLHPRMFISKWADLWMTGPYSTNVVLVLFTF